MARQKKRYEPEEEKPGRLAQLRIKIKQLIHFLTYGIWRQNPESLSGKKNILYDAIKTIILTVRNVQELGIAASARSLTYRTILSIVPLLAILFAIARGFGIENILESSIFNFMLGSKPSAKVELSSDKLTDRVSAGILPDSSILLFPGADLPDSIDGIDDAITKVSPFSTIGDRKSVV